MATSVIEDTRIIHRRTGDPNGDGDVVVYWMQQAQRAEDNDALEYAIQRANELGLPVAVVFCLVDDYPEATARHYFFMLQGLADAATALERRSIAFTCFRADSRTVFESLNHRLALLVTDRGYLPIQERWRSEVDDVVSCPFVQVETDAVVPIDEVSGHMETAARTIRPKIMKQLDDYVIERATTAVKVSSAKGSIDLGRTQNAPPVFDVSDPTAALEHLDVDHSVPPVGTAHGGRFDGGTNQARAHLEHFCQNVLPGYSTRRNRYDEDDSSSLLSPYLHFGQISPRQVVRSARAADAPEDEISAFVEEVVVRRELAFNFVAHEPDFDSFTGLPEWARISLELHAEDEREQVYTATELAEGRTNDDVWNATMNIIRETGWVHNQLRMYWGKQIVRWTNTPEHAFRTLLELNNRYFLDGRDPNSYTNVAWCFGRHDQGFKEREVSGKLRPFTTAALKRKGNLKGWLKENTPR